MLFGGIFGRPMIKKVAPIIDGDDQLSTLKL